MDDGIYDSATAQKVAFILGLQRRSGTNFLYELLCAHPECVGNSIKEDYLLAHAHHLAAYVDQYYARFPRAIRVRTSPKDLLYKCLGGGLIDYIQRNQQYCRSRVSPGDDDPAASRQLLVSKTPSVENLSNFFSLFPESPLILILRDGRDVVESNVRSFGQTYESEIEAWAAAANTVLQFQESSEQREASCLVLRYEDLHLNTERELRKVLHFLDLDDSLYDFARLEQFPVWGSSDLRKEGKSIHWKPVRKSQSFNPIGRWKAWSPETVDHFNTVAGGYMERLGYEL